MHVKIFLFLSSNLQLCDFEGFYHGCVQLPLDPLIYILVVLLRVVDWEGLGEKQSRVCAHLKVWSLSRSQRDDKLKKNTKALARTTADRCSYI